MGAAHSATHRSEGETVPAIREIAKVAGFAVAAASVFIVGLAIGQILSTMSR